MLESQETSEEDSIQGNGWIDKNLGWTSHDTSSSVPPEMAEIISLIERMVQAKVSDVLNENKELKELLAEKDDCIASLSKENIRLRNATIDLTLKNQKLQENFNESQSLKGGNESVSGCGDYDFKYDATNFELADHDVIDSFFLKLINLAQKQDSTGNYLVDCASAIAPIFILLKKDEKIAKKYRYNGTLESFCSEWNCNVAANITDEEHSKKLTCKYNSIKAVINRAPFKDSSPASWKRLLDEGKNKDILNRAINIKVQMEKLFS
jgi:hypothetical protein